MEKINMVDFANNLLGGVPSKEIIKEEPTKRIYSEHLTSDEYNAWLDYMLLINCPLCEHWHKNNTYCQMNDNGGCDE
tara:strand:- start:1346 stop:1576 length:231 start_codon:yes stop_codon:yes gene_type:complete